jgi:hypothetical protein
MWILERFHNSRALFDIVQGGIYFLPSDEKLLLGIPDKKIAPWRGCFRIQLLWFRS